MLRIKRCSLFLSIIGLLTVSLMPTLYAQRIEMPPGVSQPAEAMPNRKMKDSPRLAWSNSSGTKLRNSNKPASSSNGVTLEFLQPVYIALEHQPPTGESNYLLCETVSPDSRIISKFLGWVDEKWLLLSNEAVTLKLLNSGKKAGTIHRKGMAVISEQSSKSFGKKGVPSVPWLGVDSNAAKAVIFRAPRLQTQSDTSDFARELPLFSFYFVYAETTGLPIDFILVGTAANFNATAPQDVVRGWIPKVNHAAWDNRIGYQWAYSTFPEQRKEPGFVFQSARAACNFIQNKTSLEKDNEPPESVFMETIENGRPVPLPDDAMRMPWLENQVLEMAGIEVARVGWVGGVDNQKRSLANKNLERLAAESRTLELMFLIDHTDSMQPHFPSVADAVSKIVDDMQKKFLATKQTGMYERQMRLSISYYGDEEYPEDTPTVIRKFQPITGNELKMKSTEKELKRFRLESNVPASAMLEELKIHEAYGGGYIEEDLLVGIDKAIGAFRDDFGRKILFVIGDMGDKSKALAGDPKIRQIAEKLANRPWPITLIPLQVTTKASQEPSGVAVAKTFTEQLTSVIQRRNEILLRRGASESELVPLKVTAMSDRKQLIDTIIKFYDDLQNEIARLQRGLNNANPSQLTSLEIASLKANQIDLEALQSPLFREGFITHKPRKTAISEAIYAKDVRQVERRVLFNRQDLAKLQLFLEGFIDALDPNSNRDGSAGPVVQALVRSLFGEDFGNNSMSISESLELALGLKLNKSVLKRLAEATELGNMDGKDYAQLKAFNKQLVDILNGTPREWKIDQNPKTKEWQAKPMGELGRDRSFSLLGDPFKTKWFWLRESELP